MQYAILRFAKYKGPEISGIEAHNERTKEKYESNPDIDPTRTHLNFHFIKPERKYRAESERQIKEAGCRTRSDSIRVVEALVTASPEFFKGKKCSELKGFFNEALDFIKQHQFPETIISAVVHLDEKSPHMHLCFIPLTEDKRLCAKEIVGNKKKLTEWQDKFWEHMVKKYPDLERGESASETGRDHIMVGYYLEYVFPEKQVRYIAVSENEDPKKGLSDFVPFKNLFNEWLAKDTSRKVKTALHAKYAAGERTFTYAPLGYIRHPEIKNALVIDVETSWIIEKIFDLAYHGAGAAKIARVLVEEHVLTAGWLNFQRYGKFAHIYDGAPAEKSYAWTVSQIKSILKDETYIGNSVHNKQTNISYKKKARKPQEEWFRVENTHEAIISREVFEQVQTQIASRRRQQKDATTQIFSGLVKCADCGWSMRFGTNRQNSKPYSHYTCSQYGQGLKQCSAHYIRYDYLYHYVLTRIQELSRLAQLDERELLHWLRLLFGLVWHFYLSNFTFIQYKKTNRLTIYYNPYKAYIVTTTIMAVVLYFQYFMGKEHCNKEWNWGWLVVKTSRHRYWVRHPIW
ncbi:MAG: plasmid recombination protein [Clostridia bacterium]|nr:plasmid recombination protein [Clostridia bacterium]